jgi:hypothetical protein
MRTKLCVLGAVLGSASFLPGVCGPSLEDVRRTNNEAPPEGRASRRLPSPPDAVPARPAIPGPRHPCELITVMQVPCDPAATTCEYTYWECPRNVEPLKA